MRSLRRLAATLVASLVVVVFALPTVAVAADTAVLATESHDEAPGPEPKERHEEDNYGAPSVHEGPRFARFVAAVLTIAAVGGVVLSGYLYLLLVRRPRARQSSNA